MAATMASLVAAAPAAADSDQYGNSLNFYTTPCNPTSAVLSVAVLQPTVVALPYFLNGVAWVDYFGFPVVVLPPFRAERGVINRGAGAIWPWPSPSAIPPGQYTMHVLLQGNGEMNELYNLVFTTVSATATFDSRLNPDCTPTAAVAASAVEAATITPSPRLLARGVQAARHSADSWSKGSLGPRVRYPKARICGSTICVKSHAGAAWQPLAGR